MKKAVVLDEEISSEGEVSKDKEAVTEPPPQEKTAKSSSNIVIEADGDKQRYKHFPFSRR